MESITEIITSKFVKKFQRNGEPDKSYFGPGMYANYLYEPIRHNVKTCEIYPNLEEEQVSLNHIVTKSMRSFEICKQIGIDLVRLVIRTTNDDIEGFAKSLNVDYELLDKEIPIVTDVTDMEGCKQFFFDFELMHQLNFTALGLDQNPIINKLIRAISSHKNIGIRIQFLFTSSLMWNSIAKLTTFNLSRYLRSVEQGSVKSIMIGFDRYVNPRFISKTHPRITELASSTYQIGKKIEKTYQQKMNSSPITLSIRGLIIGKNVEAESAIQDIGSVFDSIGFVGDCLDCHIYNIDYERGYSWLENNALCSEYSINILQNNSNMWTDMRWGKGRDFVSFLCLNSDEFPIFVSLPTDPTLPISYRRKRLKGLNYEKSVFRLGTTI